MPNDRAQAFADRLQQLETSGDVDAFVAEAFTDDAELSRPEARQHVSGGAGAATFWTQYLAQFDTIHSEFSRVSDSGDLGVLEWTSTGARRGGADITYRGVSLLDFDADGRVQKFATYYDTAPFHNAPVG